MTGGETLILMAVVMLAWILRAEGNAADRRHEDLMRQMASEAKLLTIQQEELARLIVNSRRD